MRYSFDECIRRLKAEVDSKLAASGIGSTGGSTNPLPKPANGKKDPETMTQDECKAWFTTNAIDNSIVNYLSSCDGLILKQLHEMKHSNPPFYDQSLSAIAGINMMMILKFNAALEKLFS